MEAETLKKVGKSAGAAGIGGASAAGVLLIVVNTIWSDMKVELKDTRFALSVISERMARIEGRQEKLVNYSEWRDGHSERLAEIKESKP